ncbi:hypothetical protein PRIPAC_85922 [Pristionchus pacificus]|uniref:C2H2-type domain-containing protein n=1 Tax=Pristionchus pacificus TaxID=54126 RepID=A0A2A6BP15_PRIPA|nr:hypothetical protein PRIPAC_85922 [Pristionchus pacificus]|eukprot:PDM67523.1 hypothetical protein PRIPAC_48940 [Pristionchus pacificus]
MDENDNERCYSTCESENGDENEEESDSDESSEMNESPERSEGEEEVEEEVEEEQPVPPTVSRCSALERLEFEQKLADEYEKRRAAAEAKYNAQLLLFRADPRFELHEKADPTNIFQLCRPGTPDTISMKDAFDELNPSIRFTPYPMDARWDANFKQWPLKCVLCDSTVEAGYVVEHFFNNTHYNKVCDRGAAVSYPAVNYWMGKMIRCDSPLKFRISPREMPRIMSVGRRKSPMMSVRIPPDLLTGGGGNDQSNDNQRGQARETSDEIARDDDSASEKPVEKRARNESMSTPHSPSATTGQQPAASSFSADAIWQQNQSIPHSSPIAVQQSHSSSSVNTEQQPDPNIGSINGGVDGPTKEADKNVEISESTREINRLKTENAELRRLKEELSHTNNNLNEELERTKKQGEVCLDKECELTALLTEQIREGTLERTIAERRNRELTETNAALTEALDEIKRKDEKIEELEVVIHKMRRDGEIRETKLERALRANAFIEGKFKEMKTQKSDDIASELKDLQHQFTKLKEGLEKEKRADDRRTTRDVMGLFQANVDLKKKLEEKTKTTELIRTNEVITLDDDDEPSTSSGGGRRRSGPSQEQPRRSGRARKPLSFKRNAIAGDMSTIEQPIEKIAKNEEKALPDPPRPPPPSLDVEDLRRKMNRKPLATPNYVVPSKRRIDSPPREVVTWNGLEEELHKSDLEKLELTEGSCGTNRADNGAIDEHTSNVNELNAEILELRRNEVTTKKRMDALLQVNVSIVEKFQELRKKAKASKDFGDILREKSDLKESYEKMAKEVSRLKEGLEMEKRKQNRTNCRELMLFHENIELKKKLEETNKRNEHFTGGMAQLLAQCGIPQLQPLPMLQQQQQLLQPDPPAGPSSSVAAHIPRNMIMSRRIVDEITVDSHGSRTETSTMNNESLVRSVIERPPGERRQREQMNDEAPTLASDLAEVKLQLRTKEDMFQRACRATREAELRAERAEKFLDAKREVLEDSSKNEELETRLAELTTQLTEARTNNNDLKQENSVLKKSLEEAWRKVDAVRAEEGHKNWQLQQQLQHIRQSVMGAGPSFGAGPHQWMQSAQPAGLFPGSYAGGPFAGPYAGPAMPQLVTPKRPARLSETAHPTNILEPCRPSVVGAIAFDAAIAQIEAKYNECRARGLPTVSKLLANHFKKYECPSTNVICSLCDERVEHQSIFFHFKSQQHMNKKRNAIAGDDSDSEQPVEKIAKNEEKSIPPSPFATIQLSRFSSTDAENLMKTYENCRALSEARYRSATKNEASDGSKKDAENNELALENDRLKLQIAELRTKEDKFNSLKEIVEVSNCRSQHELYGPAAMEKENENEAAPAWASSNKMCEWKGVYAPHHLIFKEDLTSLPYLIYRGLSSSHQGMEKPATADRRSSTKRDAIDSSDSEQPGEKIARKEENSIPSSSPATVQQSPSSSPSDAEIQQNLMKTYERYRAISEAVYRERKSIDSKNDGVDSAKKEEEKGELARENYRLKHEIAELRSKEDKLNSFINDLTRANNALKNALEQEQKKTQKLNTIIDELTCQDIYTQNGKLEVARRNEEDSGNRELNKLASENAGLKEALDVERKELEDSINRERVCIRETLNLKDQLDIANKRQDEGNKRESDLTLKNSSLKDALEVERRELEDSINRERACIRENLILKDQLEMAKKKEDDASNKERDLISENSGLRDELEAEKKNGENSISRERDLIREISGLRDELEAEKKNGENSISRERDSTQQNLALKEQLEVANKMVLKGNNREGELTQEIFGLNEELNVKRNRADDLAQQNSALQQELEEIKRKADEGQKRDRERFDELTSKLAQLELQLQQHQPAVQQELQQNGHSHRGMLIAGTLLSALCYLIAPHNSMPVDFDDVTDEPMAAVPDEDGDVEVPLEEEVVEQRILRKRREKTTSMTSMTTVTTPAGGEKQGGGKQAPPSASSSTPAASRRRSPDAASRANSAVSTASTMARYPKRQPAKPAFVSTPRLVLRATAAATAATGGVAVEDNGGKDNSFWSVLTGGIAVKDKSGKATAAAAAGRGSATAAASTSSSTRLICEICDAKQGNKRAFRSCVGIERHLVTVHSLKLTHGLVKHLSVDHQVQMRRADVTFPCDQCTFRCHRYHELEAHLNKQHRKAPASASTD